MTIRLHIWSPNIVIGNFFMIWITTKFSNFQDQSFINTFSETWFLLLFLILQLSNQSIKGRQLFLSNDGLYESFITGRRRIQHDMHYGFSLIIFPTFFKGVIISFTLQTNSSIGDPSSMHKVCNLLSKCSVLAMFFVSNKFCSMVVSAWFFLVNYVTYDVIFDR